MRFMPRNNMFYATIAGMSPIYRYVLTVLVIASITYLWLFKIYFKVDGVITTYRKEIEHIREQSKACDCSQASCKRLECLVNDLHGSVQAYQATIAADQEQGRINGIPA